MSTHPYLIQDDDGRQLGVLMSVRKQWAARDALMLVGRRYRVAGVVELDSGDPSGCAAALTVKYDPFG